MPGRTPAQAREAFLTPLRRSLSCITTEQLFVPSKKPGDVEALALSADPLLLYSARIGSIRLLLDHQFRVIKDGRSSWHVSSVAYRYHLSDVTGRELMGWHWHPGTGTDHPHLHVSEVTIGRHAHVPTGRVSIEAVLWFLLTDLKVSPTHSHTTDYADVLAAVERPFIRHRRWHARGPGDEGS